jgi:hypothetical protein
MSVTPPLPPRPDDVVTAVDHPEGMWHSPQRTAVCVVRAERQETGLLITLVINPDIEEISAQRSLRVADIDAALDAVRQFLVGFAQDEAR